MAASAVRCAANRANAQKSTGPRTAAGKRASSQNARKTPPCPFSFHLPAHYAEEAFLDALRRTAPCPDGRARLLLINRCLLQAHEIRWHALERALFETACNETDGSPEEEALWIARNPEFVKGLLAYRRWIARRINQVERALAALAAQSARGANAMAAAAGTSSMCATLDLSALGPEGLLPLIHTAAGWSYGPFAEEYPGRPAAPASPRQSLDPPDRPLRVRFRLYLDCPADAGSPNEPNRIVGTPGLPPAPARFDELCECERSHDRKQADGGEHVGRSQRAHQSSVPVPAGTAAAMHRAKRTQSAAPPRRDPAEMAHSPPALRAKCRIEPIDPVPGRRRTIRHGLPSTGAC